MPNNYTEARINAKILGEKSLSDPTRPAINAEAQLYATLAVADALHALTEQVTVANILATAAMADDALDTTPVFLARVKAALS